MDNIYNILYIYIGKIVSEPWSSGTSLCTEITTLVAVICVYVFVIIFPLSPVKCGVNPPLKYTNHWTYLR